MAVAFVHYDHPQTRPVRVGRHLSLVDTAHSVPARRRGRSASWLVYAPLVALFVLAVAFVLSTGSVSPASVVSGGDIPASASVDVAPTPVAPLASFGSTYTAQAGDTYWSIAAALVTADEAPAYVHRLIAVNGPEALRAGRMISIPMP